MYEEKRETVAEGHIDAGRTDGIQQSSRSTHQTVNIVVPTGTMDFAAAPGKEVDAAQQAVTLDNGHQIELWNEQQTEVAGEPKLQRHLETEHAQEAG